VSVSTYRLVVLADDQRLASDIIDARLLGRVEREVVHAAAGKVHHAATQTIEDLLLRHVNVQHAVERQTMALEHSLQRFGLRYVARVAVENPARGVDLLVRECLGDDAEHQVVRHQLYIHPTQP